MKILIVKMSSLGDVLHTFPAVTDAGKVIPDIHFDWVVEENFAEVPAWHPLIKKVISIPFRRLRKTPFRSFLFSREWRHFKKALREEKYDLVIDAQGLIKSALIARKARGMKAGLDKYSAWEPLGRFAYQKKYSVNPNQHAVTRVRQLFAQALGYKCPAIPADYGIHRETFAQQCNLVGKFVIFLHGTTWTTKLYPEAYWQSLLKQTSEAGVQVYLPWGNAEEHERALRLANVAEHAQVLPRINLRGMANVIAGAVAIVAVDTGLGHLAAALGVPTISLYGPTDPKLTGTVGDNQIHLSAKFPCAPCFQRECTYRGDSIEQPACFDTISPDRVWEHLTRLITVS